VGVNLAILNFLNYGPRRAPTPLKVVATVAFVAGGLLLVWSGYIHFHLWREEYRHIPTIGPLFLFQSIAGLVLGLLVIALRRVWTAIVGLGFAAATLVGFFISVEHGLFGFQDSSSAPFAHEALIIEICTIVVLIIAGLLCFAASPSSTTAGTTPPARESTDA
jgi:hypothetical protein